MFWKLNTAFFDPTGNCPSLYFCQLLDAYVPDALTPHWLVKWVVWSGPYVTELVEGGVALLMATPGWSTRCGIALALLLHALIAITPPPNNIGAYGVMLGVRWFFLLPAAVVQVFVEFGVLSMLVTTVALILTIWLASHWPTSSSTGMVFQNVDDVPMDWTVPAYAALFLLYCFRLLPYYR